MDWDSLGPLSLVLTAAAGIAGGGIKWVDTIRQRRRTQMIEALKFRLAAEEKDHAEAEDERDQYRAAYFTARATLRAYEKQLVSAGIIPDPEWEEPDV
ncbi:hypothetical protein [Brachybacterium sp. AOP3-A1-3]|uniref:hypothetical protein n=1 Tax=Brachybacterium sp. AOP3-A1-3 TaxID=3457699 RepID=UPI0040348209